MTPTQKDVSEKFYLRKEVFRERAKELIKLWVERERVGMTREERQAFAVQVAKQVEELSSEGSLKQIWQAEIFRDGLRYYFSRYDIVERLKISDEQQKQFGERLKEGRKELSTFVVERREIALREAFDALTPNQREKLEKIIGLSLSQYMSIALNRTPIPENELENLFALYGLHLLDSRILNVKTEPSDYQHGIADVLYELTCPRGESLSEIRSDASALKQLTALANQCKTVNKVPDNSGLGEAWGGMFAEQTEALGIPLTEDQMRRLKDSYFVPLKNPTTREELTELYRRHGHSSNLRLVKEPSYARRRLKKMSESLSDEQRVLSRDILLFSIGAFRLALCEPVARQLEMDESQRKRFIVGGYETWQRNQDRIAELKQTILSHVFEVLDEQQRTNLENHIGISLMELGARYAEVPDNILLQDFR
jgi:hypothetical protein